MGLNDKQSIVIVLIYILHPALSLLYAVHTVRIRCNQAAASCMFNFPYLVSDTTEKHSNATF